MTGKDLIMFILQNDLLDTEFFTNGRIPGLMTVEEAAVKFDTGTITVEVWFTHGDVRGIVIGGKLYIYENTKDPRKSVSKEALNVR